MSHRLSKSRYTAGVQCHKLLWWKVHEPLAVELQPDKVLQDRFDQGAQVGTLARDRFPGGVLVDLPYQAVNERVKLTQKLIAWWWDSNPQGRGLAPRNTPRGHASPTVFMDTGIHRSRYRRTSRGSHILRCLQGQRRLPSVRGTQSW